MCTEVDMDKVFMNLEYSCSYRAISSIQKLLVIYNFYRYVRSKIFSSLDSGGAKEGLGGATAPLSGNISPLSGKIIRFAGEK